MNKDEITVSSNADTLTVFKDDLQMDIITKQEMKANAKYLSSKGVLCWI